MSHTRWGIWASTLALTAMGAVSVARAQAAPAGGEAGWLTSDVDDESDDESDDDASYGDGHHDGHHGDGHHDGHDGDGHRYPTWNPYLFYRKGDRVTWRGHIYKALHNIQGEGDESWIRAVALWQPRN